MFEIDFNFLYLWREERGSTLNKQFVEKAKTHSLLFYNLHGNVRRHKSNSDELFFRKYVIMFSSSEELS